MLKLFFSFQQHVNNKNNDKNYLQIKSINNLQKYHTIILANWSVWLILIKLKPDINDKHSYVG